MNEKHLNRDPQSQSNCINVFNWELYKSPLQQRNSETIFYILDFGADTFQANTIFQNLFGMSPKNFVEFKNLILVDDLEKLECIIIENKTLTNSIMPLRMRTKDEVYTWFIITLGQIDENIISGTLDIMHLEEQKPNNDDFNTLACRNITNDNDDYANIEDERRKFALEAASAGLWDWDTVTNKVYYDSKYINMLGYSESEFKNSVSSWADQVHPEDYDKTVKRQFEYIESPQHGNYFTCKYRFRASCGNYIWIQGQGKVIARDSNGKALRIVGLHTDVTEEEKNRGQIDFMLTHDILTGLHNRNHFETQFSQMTTNSLPTAYILVDADGLKMINDCINHTAGDRILQQIAHTLRISLRSTDFLARIGGDEFAILLPNTIKEDAIKIVKKIQKAIQDANELNTGVAVCASLGLACATTVKELTDLTIRADIAMAKQKQIQKPNSLQQIVKSLDSQRYANYKDERIQK